jgi:phage antirepressor YoqD-like protein
MLSVDLDQRCTLPGEHHRSAFLLEVLVKYLSNEKMSIKEMSEALLVGESTIRRAIEKHFPGFLSNGRKTLLDELQVTVIKKEIEKHHNSKLASTGEVIKTELEKTAIIQQGYSLLMDKMQELNKQLSEAQPKIEFYDAVKDSKDAVEMSAVAKMLDREIGRNKLFELLREKQILRQNNEPYQKYIDDGWFRVIENYWVDSAGESHIKTKTLVYQKGIEKINKLIGEN